MENRHQAESDHMASSQVRLGHLLEKRSLASRIVPGDKVWLDSKHTPIDLPYKVTDRWFAPFEVLTSDGAAVTLDLPETFGKAHRKVGKTGVTADRDKIEFRLFNSSSIFYITLREELFSLPK